MDEHVVTAVVADDEAESLLRIEELDDALPFADDLGRHSTSAASEAATGTAAAESAAIGTTVATVAAAESATVTVRPLAEPAALSKTAAIAGAFLEEPVALVPAATAAVALTPSIETHTRQLSLCPNHL
jgi:hypothetical protein